MTLLLIFLTLLLPTFVHATSYYVATAGSDSNNGLTTGTAWLTVQHAANTAVAGDTVNIGAGTFVGRVTFPSSGTSGSPIVFQGTRGSGGSWDTIIDGSDSTSSWVAAPEVGSGVWKTAAIGYQPFALTSGGKTIWRISNPVMAASGEFCTTGDGFHYLAKGASSTYHDCAYLGTDVTFWDGIEALFGYLSGTTYLRFRGGDDPAGMSVRSAPSGGVLTLTSKNYITLRNLKIVGGQFGVRIEAGTGHVVEFNDIRNGNVRVYVYGGTGHIVRQNELVMDGYGFSTYVPGDANGGSYARLINRHIYDINKFVVGETDENDNGVQLWNTATDVIIANNHIYNGVVGIGLRGQSNTLISSNNIHNHSAQGIYSVENGSATVESNTFTDNEHHMRIEMDPDGKSFDIYKNRFHLPVFTSLTGGKHIALDVIPENYTSDAAIRIYHNSFAGGGWATDCGYSGSFASFPNTEIKNNFVSTDGMSSSGSLCGSTTATNYQDPIWYSSTVPDFILPPGHAAINSGTDMLGYPGITTAYYGDGQADIGAVQSAGEPPPLTPQTYYMSTTGSNSNTCAQAKSTSTPKLSFASVLPCMASGDTLYLRGGTYTDRIDTMDVPVPGGTSWDNSTLIASYPDETATIQIPSGQPVAMWFHTSSTDHHIVIDRIVLDLNDQSNTTGLAFQDGAHHIRFQNGEVKNSHFENVLIDNADHIQIINTLIHDHATTDGNVTIKNGSANAVLNRNSVYNGVAAGIRVESSTDTLIMNNVIYDNDGCLRVTTGAATTKMYNNTCTQNTTTGVQIDSGSSGGELKNTIVYNNGAGIVNNGGATLATNLTADPSFTNPGTNDFHLTVSSTNAIEQGTTLTDVTVDRDNVSRPQGMHHDIGAYESTTFATPSVLFVDNTESCPGNGSDATPYCTIQGAVTAVMAGQTIKIRFGTGTYDESVTAAASGTFAERITIESDDRANQPKWVHSGDGVAEAAFNTNNKEYWTLQYLTFDGTGVWTSAYAVWVKADNWFESIAGDIHGITVQYCVFKNWGGSEAQILSAYPNGATALVVSGGYGPPAGTTTGMPSGVIIRNNRFEGNRHISLGMTTTKNSLVESNVFTGLKCGVQDSGSGDHAVVTDGIHIVSGTTGVGGIGDVYRSNVFYDFDEPANCGLTPTGGTGYREMSAIHVDVGPAYGFIESNTVSGLDPTNSEPQAIALWVEENNHGWVVRNNVVHNVGAVGIRHAPSSVGPTNYLVNNTVSEVGWYGIQVMGGQVVVENNLVDQAGIAQIQVTAGAVSQGNLTIDNNLYWSGSAGTSVGDWNGGGVVNFTTWKSSCSCDAAAVNDDPDFSGVVGSHPYNILGTSPAKDAGTTIAFVQRDIRGLLRPQGVAYDIGAYEFGAVPVLRLRPITVP